MADREAVLSGLSAAVLNGDEASAAALARDALSGGIAALEAIEQGLVPGIRRAGALWEEGEYFLPELVTAAQAMKAAMAVLQPVLERDGAGHEIGRVVIGTVQGDIHDIGKDIVALMLGIEGYAVHDLGIDVPVEDFVAAVKEHDADIVGLSGLLTLAFDAMRNTVDGIAAAGLRDNVKIMVGGAPVDESVRAYTGADGWGNDAGRAVTLAAEWADGGS
jgi:5-methyltetrahydrofolate--homocysteine methyltransferase